MAEAGKTPILLYGSTTATNTPVTSDLTNSSNGCEIAINVADKNLFFKDSTNAVNTVPIRQSSTSSDGWLSSTDWNTFNNKQPAGSYLTAVTADSPLSGSGTSGSHLVIAQASTSTSGYLSSTDWNTFNNKGSGTVTSVTGTSPVVSSGGATPAISMPAATTSVSGYLTSTDWNTFNNKGSGTVTSVTATSPVTSTGGTTPVIAMPAATGSVDGYLTSTDWNTFNSKQPAGTYVTSISVASSNGLAGTSSGGATPSLTLSTSVTGLLKGNGTAISAAVSGTDYAPATSGTSILYGNGAGGFSNVTVGSGLSFTGGTLASTSGGGSVTSVTLDTGSTGLTVSGGTTQTITGSGTFSVAGTLGVGYGGTGTATAFTAGSVVFAGASGVYTQDNANLFWDDTNNRLGIGTASPSTNGALTVSSAGASNYITVNAGSVSSLIGTDSNGLVLSSLGSNNLLLQTSGTERIRINSTGLTTLASGSGLSVSATAVTSPAAGDGNVFSGTYTPSLTNTTNIGSSTATTCQYMRVGNTVTVSGQVTVDATTAGAQTVLRMSLPIASNFSLSAQLGGAGASITASAYGNSMAILGDTANDVAEFRWLPTLATAQIYNFTFTYQVI